MRSGQHSNPYNLEYNRDNLPVLQNQTLYSLYTTDLDISQEAIDNILSLPRENLIGDLEILLYDAIVRGEELTIESIGENESCFPIHAIFLLTELKAEESLPVILEFLKIDEEQLDYYLGDYLTELIWECLHILGGSQKERLYTFITDEDIYEYSRIQASVAISQRALHFPEEREEIIEWYRKLLVHFHQQATPPHPSFLGLIVTDVLDIEGYSLYEEVRNLYIDGLVSPGVVGPWSKVEGYFLKPRNDKYDPVLKLRSIHERYTYFSEERYIHQKPHQDFRLNPTSNPNTFVRPSAKVGRNEPCPCGSGKKYKKCCLEG